MKFAADNNSEKDMTLNVSVSQTIVSMVIGTASFMLFGAHSLDPEGPSTVQSALLSQSQMSETVGGMEIQSFNEPTSGTTFQLDNVRLDVDLRHQLLGEDTVILETYVNNSKEQAFVVSTPTEISGYKYGSIQTRMNWPLGIGGNATLDLKFCDLNSNPPCGYSTTGSTSQNNLELDSNLKVFKVWFHNTQTPDGHTPSEATALGALSAPLYVDNPDFVYRHTTFALPGALLEATDSIDPILAQCDTDTPDNGRVQFRFHALDMLPLSYATATSTRPFVENAYLGNGSTVRTRPWDQLEDAFEDTGFKAYMDVIDPNKDYLHVFIVKEIQVDEEGPDTDMPPDGLSNADGEADFFPDGMTFNYQATGCCDALINGLVIKDSLDPFKFTSILAHEIGHNVGDLDHVDDPPLPECGQLSTSEQTISIRNLMCGTVGAGRKLTDASSATPFISGGQCRAIYENDRTISLKDWN